MFIDIFSRGGGEGAHDPDHPHFNRELFLSLCSVFERARQEKNTFLSQEHFMFELLENPEVRSVLLHCGFTPVLLEEIKGKLEKMLEICPGEGNLYSALPVMRALSQVVIRSKAIQNKVGGVYLLYCFLSNDSQGGALLKTSGISRDILKPYFGVSF